MEHYYTNDPTSKSDIRRIDYEVGGKTFHYLTDHGVFSIERVDHGSDILIRTVLNEEDDITGTAIDLGCGYGPIGITLARFYKQSSWRLIDVNDRAMDLARRNAQMSAVIDRIQVGLAEKMAEPGCAEVVVTNPPIRAGKDTIYGLFANACEWLAPGGRLYVVIRKNQGAPSAVKELTRLFGNCETVERESGFHVLKCVKA